MASKLFILASAPFLLVQYCFNITRSLSPWGRPVKEWTLGQAINTLTVRLFLRFVSLLHAGDRLSLEPGPERNRFEIIQPKAPNLYTGPLQDAAIKPGTTGATWTPARPPSGALSKKSTVVLHIHGGAFVLGHGRDQDMGYLARTLVRHMGCAYVCTPQYRLSGSKGGRFPAALQDALTSYLHLIEVLGIPSSQIVLSGDSAGGNIVLALLRYISEYGRELDIPAPAAVALWSPWVDVGAALEPTWDITSSPNYTSDFLNPEFPRWGALAITGPGAVEASGPYLSPLRHPFKMNTEVPLFVNAGEREVLYDEIKAFSKGFGGQGWPLHLVASKGCPHDIVALSPLLGFQEQAEAAVRDAKAFFSATEQYSISDSILSTTMSSLLDVDVVIIGAGISGINAAYRIQSQGPPGLKYVILESRDSIGGTWDLFRYPGIRSDSDVFTFCLPWSPWGQTDTLAAGGDIKNYLIRSAQSAGIDQHIRYRHKVTTADWRSADQTWIFHVDVPGEEKPVIYRSRFVLLGTGYYDYETPLQAAIPGLRKFKGEVIHPQFWPEDYDYTGKDVVIIGSGATAITILPSITDKASRATMLQRSPGYVFSVPSSSRFATLLSAILPATLVFKLNRTWWLIQAYLMNKFCKNFPEAAKNYIRKATIRQLPPTIKWDPHFKPRYNPWDQRLCACKDGDFFAALRSGKADIVTDKIKTVTANSIELESGAALHPDVIITATGLKLKVGGGIRFSVDGTPFAIADKFAWKAAMLEDVPNLFFLMGYENASWTLGADVGAHLFIRLLRLMKQKNAKVIVPRPSAPMKETPMMNLSSTYIQVAGPVFPKGGTGHWSPKTNYIADMVGATWGNVTQDLYFQ
ncbi:FAD/NAD(P)-binding domain-containing protein [Nemania sp. NC0429]|nr:FAD/NAD(P)-binding domain-containing protein [Nemania sp. NC0429]